MRLKVLHVIHSLSGGGAETQSQILACALEGFDIESHFFCVSSEGHQLSDSSKIVSFPRSSKFDFTIFSTLDQLVKSIKPDVVHAWLPAMMTIPAMLVGKKNAVPVMFSYRNRMYFHRAASYPEFLAALFFSSKIVSNNFIEQSNLAFRWLYRKKKGETIYNAVKPRMLKCVPPIKKSTYRFLYVGRLTAQKNIALMLEALALIKSSEEWHLDLFGVGEMHDELLALTDSLGLSTRVSFRGYCADIYPEMLESDLLIFPSLYEGMPNVLVEALEAGLPVIASDIVASRDLIEDSDSVYWFDSKEAGELADGLKRFIESPSSFQLKVANGLAVSGKFSIEALAENYNTVYRSLL